MKGSIIFIAGVHGVGKGTLAKQVSKETGISCFTASDLIKESKRAPVDYQKNVIDAEKNQEYLVSMVLEKTIVHDPLILDGHFTLWSDQEVFSIPIAVFQNLPIQAIILVEEPPETVGSRLSVRDGSSKTVEQIAQALKRERDRAMLVQQELGVPMLTVSSNQSNKVSGWIQRVRRIYQ